MQLVCPSWAHNPYSASCSRWLWFYPDGSCQPITPGPVDTPSTSFWEHYETRITWYIMRQPTTGDVSPVFPTLVPILVPVIPTDSSCDSEDHSDGHRDKARLPPIQGLSEGLVLSLQASL
jgi:hypothetical protein